MQKRVKITAEFIIEGGSEDDLRGLNDIARRDIQSYIREEIDDYSPFRFVYVDDDKDFVRLTVEEV